MVDWNRREVRLVIGDEGPGILPAVLGATGEFNRTGGSGEAGVGLGGFIAKTLLVRTGARVVFGH